MPNHHSRPRPSAADPVVEPAEALRLASKALQIQAAQYRAFLRRFAQGHRDPETVANYRAYRKLTTAARVITQLAEETLPCPPK